MADPGDAVIFHQYELVRGNVHRVVWLDGSELHAAVRHGWKVLHIYPLTGLVRDHDGRLVFP